MQKEQADPDLLQQDGSPRPQGEPGTQGAQTPQGRRGQGFTFAFARVTDAEPTSDTTSYKDLGGPGVTVDVLASGFIEAGASAFTTVGAGGVVS